MNAPELLKTEADNCDAQSGLSPASLFDRCVEWKLMKDGSYECHCKLGLWGVSGPTREIVAQEAMHYWTQYFHDGEYSKHLSNDQAQAQPRVTAGREQNQKPKQ